MQLKLDMGHEVWFELRRQSHTDLSSCSVSLMIPRICYIAFQDFSNQWMSCEFVAFFLWFTFYHTEKIQNA